MSLSLGNHLALKANSSAINCDIKGQKGAKKSARLRSFASGENETNQG